MFKKPTQHPTCTGCMHVIPDEFQKGIFFSPTGNVIVFWVRTDGQAQLEGFNTTGQDHDYVVCISNACTAR